ncbi:MULTISPECIES: ethanolamine utilization protein EutJ [Anaerolinea]|uniref:ethanolamine utilization protein EutJ n=1 Tax=Anaerolinea TaxID=233189 RepID=UPI00262D22E0|nr:ethanolamine utilization protein EutJ [Anaerolinea thermophila]
MNPNLHAILKEADQAILRHSINGYRGRVRCGVDLGTAYVSLFVLTEDNQPLVGTYQYAEIVRDGLVVDFGGAVELVRKLKAELEGRLGFELQSAATAYPPGVPIAEVRATRYVLEAAGLTCSALVDEPTAANAVLEVKNGAVVDIGGGTTGIAIIQEGNVIYTADEPTGGTHFTLVISGALKIPFAEAEARKINPEEQTRLFNIVRPVMEKVGTIIQQHIQPYPVDCIYLVGGTSAFKGIDRVIENITGVKTVVPGNPLFVTPLGIAMNDQLS